MPFQVGDRVRVVEVDNGVGNAAGFVESLSTYPSGIIYCVRFDYGSYWHTHENRMRPERLWHPSLCMTCIGHYHVGEKQGGPLCIMLSGYCVTACRCDCCRNVTDLALCKIEYRSHANTVANAGRLFAEMAD